jgi:hypothetical protein
MDGLFVSIASGCVDTLISLSLSLSHTHTNTLTHTHTHSQIHTHPFVRSPNASSIPTHPLHLA